MKSRNHVLRVRFSEDEWQKLVSLSQNAGLNRSALVRDHLDKVKIRNRQNEKMRLVLLNRINANLNMIARWVNNHQGAAEAVEVIAHLMAIERAVKKVSQ